MVSESDFLRERERTDERFEMLRKSVAALNNLTKSLQQDLKETKERLEQLEDHTRKQK